ncbi:MAG: protein translocase subunit SecD [Sciscionella sp.]
MAPPAGRISPARYLWVFAAIVVVLYALVFGTGNHKASPKLGIDLSGGTSVTLTARTSNGQPPTKDSLNQAKQIIEQRVNGLGVTGSNVVLNGNNIVITVPGNQGEQAKSLGQTAKLGFRKVLQETAGTAPAPATIPGKSAPPSTSGKSAPTSSAPSGSQGASQSPKPQGAPMPAAGPTTQPAPPATPSNGSHDAKTAQAIQQAKKARQSTDPKAQQRELAKLNCAQGHDDVLRGNDDPKLPLVTCGRDGNKYVLGPVFLQGTQISNASATTNPQGAGYVINLSFKSAGAKTWANFTSKNVHKQAAFVLDTEVVSAPQIQQPILDGNTQISGKFSQQEAQDLANILKYGSLPLSFDSSDAKTVSASLGLASLEAGLIAGGIGLALVLIYCLFYYRVLGLLTVASLALSGIMVYAVLVLLGRWIGYSLDLAGIAGFIIAIGITADSFVIFFERLKDEVREGRTFRSAVPKAWVRARRTILASDAVSFLAAVVLYVLAVGDVQGFAFTLGMSTALDLVVVFLVTHPMVVYASRSKRLANPKLSGLGGTRRARPRPSAAAVTTAGKGV